MLRSKLYDYSDAYIVVKGTINILAAANEDNKAAKDAEFINYAAVRLFI